MAPLASAALPAEPEQIGAATTAQGGALTAAGVLVMGFAQPLYGALSHSVIRGSRPSLPEMVRSNATKSTGLTRCASNPAECAR